MSSSYVLPGMGSAKRESRVENANGSTTRWTLVQCAPSLGAIMASGPPLWRRVQTPLQSTAPSLPSFRRNGDFASSLPAIPPFEEGISAKISTRVCVCARCHQFSCMCVQLNSTTLAHLLQSKRYWSRSVSSRQTLSSLIAACLPGTAPSWRVCASASPAGTPSACRRKGAAGVGRWERKKEKKKRCKHRMSWNKTR